MTALVFPGQGAQFVGMGKALVPNPAAAAVFREADDALGWSLSTLMFDGPAQDLTRTAVAQPALLVHSIAALRAYEAAAADAESSTLPGARAAAPTWTATCGHSLGEWTALVAADALSLADAVRLVHLRGTLMQEACAEGVGGMAAVVGLEELIVVEACEAASGEGSLVVPATFNGRGQIVVSGHVEAIGRLRQALADAYGATLIDLDVSAPFHSPLMSPAEKPLAAALAQVALQPLALPVCSSVDGSWPREPEQVRTLLIRQLTAPVRWTTCVASVVAVLKAANADHGLALVGATTSMSRMLSRMRLGVPVAQLPS